MGPVLAGLKDVTGSSKTILVVDDETPLRQLIGRFLADSGWVVLDAANADEALRLVERYSDQEAIDLLVTDVVMPGGTDGFVLAAEVARIRPSIKVLYMSGHFEDRQAVRQGLREAGRYFIRKPFSRDDFLRTITSALETPVQASDAFAVILGHPGIEARAITDTRPPDGPERSLRYRVRLLPNVDLDAAVCSLEVKPGYAKLLSVIPVLSFNSRQLGHSVQDHSGRQVLPFEHPARRLCPARDPLVFCDHLFPFCG